jgi:hypothetical protein
MIFWRAFAIGFAACLVSCSANHSERQPSGTSKLSSSEEEAAAARTLSLLNGPQLMPSLDSAQKARVCVKAIGSLMGRVRSTGVLTSAQLNTLGLARKHYQRLAAPTPTPEAGKKTEAGDGEPISQAETAEMARTALTCLRDMQVN